MNSDVDNVGYTEVFNILGGVMLANRIEPDGVLHIGANQGGEVPVYRRLGFKRIVLVEANPEFAERLLAIPDVVVHIACVSNKPGLSIPFHLTTDPQASSILEPLRHEKAKTVMVRNTSLAALTGPSCNVLVLDTQGSELDVMQSGDVRAFSLVVTEINETPRYQGGATTKEVKRYLDAQGFKRVAECFHPNTDFGDAVFIHK